MRELYEHQKEGVRWLKNVRRGILAFSMGTGKTVTSLTAAKDIGSQIIVVCPPGLKSNWDNECKLTEVLAEIHSDNKIPRPPGQIQFVLIVDEAARFQTITSQRTAKMLELAKHPNCQAVFLLTGTPMRNGRPSNLYPLLRAIGHPLGSLKAEYEKKYCGAKWKAFGRVAPIADEHTGKLVALGWKCQKCGQGQTTNSVWNQYLSCKKCGDLMKRPMIIWDTTGATNLEELKKQIAPVILTRTKEECLDLPPKTRVYRDAEVTAEDKRLFKQVYEEALASFQERVKEGSANAESESLVILTAMRRAASLAKVATAIEMIESICEEGGRVICFSEYRETANQIAAQFGAMPYTGEVKMKDRDDIVKAFQSGEQNVFIGTIAAGGLGLNLTAANNVILLDRPLTPGDVLQAEDRAHRIGTHWPVTCHWLRAFPIDVKIDEMLVEKLAVISDVLGGKESGPIKASAVLRGVFRHARASKVHVHAGADI